MAAKNRTAARIKRHRRVRKHVVGTSDRPRLNVFRSLTRIYAQVIDDRDGKTVVSASSIDRELKTDLEGLTKKEQAFKIGQAVAQRALKKGVKSVIFDRGGYKYTGRVKALADGARDGGLEF